MTNKKYSDLHPNSKIIPLDKNKMTKEPLDKKIKGFGIYRKKCKKGYFDEEDVKSSLSNLKKRLEGEISDINKRLDLHNVDECECCEKNWKSIYECLEIIDKLFLEELGEELIK